MHAHARKQTKRATAPNIASYRDTSRMWVRRAMFYSLYRSLTNTKELLVTLVCDNRITMVNTNCISISFAWTLVDFLQFLLCPEELGEWERKCAWNDGKWTRKKPIFLAPTSPVFSLLVFYESFCFTSWKPFWWRELKNEVERKNSTELLIFTMLRKPARLAPNGTVH